MIELFVENRKIDIDKGFSTLLTLAIDDIKDFGAKNTTFSKTIILPGTKNNNVQFGNIFNVTAASTYNPSDKNIGLNFNAAIGASAYIFADNMQVFKGIFRILEITVDDGFIEYECAVFGELGGFVAKLGNKKLEELDFSAYNQSYSYTNIIDQTNVGTGAGVVYPLIDFGNYSTAKKDWQFKTFRPALHVKEYIDKIFAAAGYAYNCALFATARFKGLIVPHNQKALTNSSTFALNIAATSYNYVTADGASKAVTFGIQSVLGGFVASGGNTIFTSGGAAIGTLNFRIKGSFTKSSSIPFSVEVRKNGVAISAYSLGGFSAASPYSFDYDFTPLAVSFAATDTLTVVVVGPGTGTWSLQFDTGDTLLTIDSATMVADPITLNKFYKINDTIPKNILQKDFISSIVKLSNLYIFEDYDNDKALKIMPFVDYYLDATAEDWSNKIDRSKPMRYKPMSELNSRYFEFNYKDDSDFYNDLYKKRYNKSYGSYKYDSEFEFANESTKVDVIFSGTPLVGYTGEDKVYSSIFKRTGEVVGVGEDNVDSNIRILQTKVVTGVASWDIKDGATVLGSRTDYLYAGHFDDPDAPANDLNFGVPDELFFALASGSINVNQFNVYWSSYLAEITDKDSRLLMATVKLSYKDIYQLDFSKLIWIDGNLYRLNKIEDFNVTEPDTCKCEFLKIINRIY